MELPWLTPSSHFLASSKVERPGSRPAFLAVSKAVNCQPKTDVSPPAMRYVYHQPPLCLSWPATMKSQRGHGRQLQAQVVSHAVGFAQRDGGDGVRVHLRLPAGHREVARRLLMDEEPGEAIVDDLPKGPLSLVGMPAGEEGEQGQAGGLAGCIEAARPGAAWPPASLVIVEEPTAVGVLMPRDPVQGRIHRLLGLQASARFCQQGRHRGPLAGLESGGRLGSLRGPPRHDRLPDGFLGGETAGEQDCQGRGRREDRATDGRYNSEEHVNPPVRFVAFSYLPDLLFLDAPQNLSVDFAGKWHL